MVKLKIVSVVGELLIVKHEIRLYEQYQQESPTSHVDYSHKFKSNWKHATF